MLHSRTRVATVRTLTLLTLFALPTSASADFYFHYWEDVHEASGDLRLNAKVNYLSTPSDFDANGALFVPAGFQKYSRMQTELLAAYGLTSRLNAYGRIGWARAQLDHDNLNLAGSTFGFTDSSVGLNFRAFEFMSGNKPNGMTLDLQAQGDFPLYSNQGLTGPALGDSTSDFTGGAFFTLPLYANSATRLTATGGAGFTYRTASYSSAIPWSVTAALRPLEDGVLASLSVLGLESLRNDPRSATVLPTVIGSSTAYSQYAGGSFVQGAINPSLLTIRGEAGYQFGNNLSAALYASQTVWGQDLPNAFNIGLSLSMHFGNGGGAGIHHKQMDGAHFSPKDYGRSNQGFINYGLEAHITRVNDRLNLVKLDKGSQDGVELGQTFDVFLVKKDGNVGEAIARGKVSNVLNGESALTIEEFFKEIWIDEGFVAKRPVQ